VASRRDQKRDRQTMGEGNRDKILATGRDDRSCTHVDEREWTNEFDDELSGILHSRLLPMPDEFVVGSMIRYRFDWCKLNPINRPEAPMARYDADWIDSMLQPERRGSPTAEETLAKVGARPGLTVADVGCGPGFFTLAAARAIAPTGVVYAIDVETAMLDLVQKRAAAADLVNLETRRSTGERIPLDDASVDLAICGLVLHDLDDRAALVGELARITRPAGHIAVVEWTLEVGDTRRNRLAPEQVVQLLAEVGRTPASVTPSGAKQYLVLV
jgi:SAM-dependent methyltransferase